MLSRVANLVYWLARYLERAENTARLIEVNAQLVLDLQSRQGADEPRAWEPLVYVSGTQKEFFKLYGRTVTERCVLDYLLFDRRNASSVISCIAFARENARCIRDLIATEVWEDLNTFYLQLKDDSYARYAQIGPWEYLARIKLRCQQFHGVAESMIPRDQGWWFFTLGRHLERADSTSRILDVKYFMLLPDLHAVGSALDLIQWASVLRSCSAFEAFRRTRRGQLNLDRVVDFLVRDEHFPRSILFSARAAEQALDQITATAPAHRGRAARRLANELSTHLAGMGVESVIRSGLHEFLDDVQVRVNRIHAAVQADFIEHSPGAVQAQAQG